MTGPTMAALSTTALLFLGCAGAPGPGAEGPDAPADAGPPRPDVAVVERFAVGDGGLAIELVRGACADGSCAASVRLVEGDRSVDSKELDWPFGARDVEEMEVSAGLAGVGDPLSARGTVKGWGGGEGEDAPVTVARLVKLSAGEAGLLVHQAGGFEHVRRRHSLWVPTKVGLVRAWSHAEGTPPIVTSVDVVTQEEADAVVLWQVSLAFSDIGGEPDSWARTVHAWDPAGPRLRPVEGLGQGELPSPWPEPSKRSDDAGVALYAVVAGVSRSLKTAAALRGRYGECTLSFLLLSGDGVLPRFSGKTLVATLTSRRDLAEAEADRLRGCDGALAAEIATLSE